MNYVVYILYSAALDKFYVGHTGTELAVRLQKHLSDHKGFTAKAKDWVVVYRESLADKSSAYKRELMIKSWKSTKKIKSLIAEANSACPGHPDV